jgi:hypothetical protein
MIHHLTSSVRTPISWQTSIESDHQFSSEQNRVDNLKIRMVTERDLDTCYAE